MAGLETSEFVVVEEPIAEGTPADQLTESLGTKTLPAMAVAPGAATDLDQLTGLVANTALQPGEQGDHCPVLRPSSARRGRHTSGSQGRGCS